jgi:hypothetical protein
MMADAAALLIEGLLPKELAGPTRGFNPLRFVKDFSCVRKTSNSQAIEG